MLLKVILLSFLINDITCDHFQKNNSDVIVTYASHAEANVERKPNIIKEEDKIATEDDYLVDTAPTTPNFEEETEDVVFIPNEKEVRRIDDEYPRHEVKIGDIMVKKSIDDVFSKKKTITTESPNGDILFISGKNNENVERVEKHRREKERHMDTRRNGKGITIVKIKNFDCSNLDCNNTLMSVCGGKVEHKQWKYRLFLNECYFRKVNCNFRYEYNKYREVPIEKCQNTGVHHKFRFRDSSVQHSAYEPPQYLLPTPEKKNNTVWRTYPSRRSMNMGIDGRFCSHSCPISCPDDYDPECAVSNNGQRKVFVNHCKLDYYSCSYNMVWQRRPLSECVGGQKANLRQNRGFIDWMQRVGIVDNRGRLVLS